MKRLHPLAVFLSGYGSNFEAIAKSCGAGEIPATIEIVFSNNPEARGLALAKAMDLPTLCIPHYSPRQSFDQEVIEALHKYNFEWIVLCGYMRVLSPYFLQTHQGKIINIHPSLLPEYPGINAIERAYAAGEKKMGVTVHFVDEGVDTGAIILQESIEVDRKDTLEQVKQKIHQLEYHVYKKALLQLMS